jgi:hypothetical protein
MNNIGTSVSGFTEGSSNMGEFDRMPQRVRRALNYSRGKWSDDYFAQWVRLLGPDIICSMIEIGPIIFCRVSDLIRGERCEAILIAISPSMRGLSFSWQPTLELRRLFR